MAFALKQEEYTIEDIYNLPEGERAELIDGQMYMMGAPTFEHQQIISELHGTIWSYIKSKGGKCKVPTGPIGVYLNADDNTYVEPDLVIICDPSKIDKQKGCIGAPDLVIEVLSQSTWINDTTIKRKKYENAGVREYWIIDPNGETVQVCNFEKGIRSLYTLDQTVPVGIFDGLEIDFSKLDF